MTRRTLIAFLIMNGAASIAAAATGHYASVNGLRMYSDFAKTHRVIAVELQAHGHTPDRAAPLSFEQDADDVATLLGRLKIAIRHPEIARKLVLLSAVYKRSGMPPGFFEGFQSASLDKSMPKPLKEAYLKTNPDSKGLQTMFDRDGARMAAFKDIPDEQIGAIKAPALVVNGDSDVVRPEHAVELFRALPHARLAILPGGHGEYIGEICSPNQGSKVPALAVSLINDFLGKNP